MAGCRPEQGPPTRRGTVNDAGRGGRWAALVAIHNHLYVESLLLLLLRMADPLSPSPLSPIPV